MKNNNMKSGKASFNIFLDIVGDVNIVFLKNNYLNVLDYSCFFFTEKIDDNHIVADMLKRKKSLELAYITFNENQKLKLCFYFGIKGYMLEYGFIDPNKYEVFKIGEFKADDSYLNKISKHKSFKYIRNILINIKIKNLIFLQTVKKDFDTLFKIDHDVQIIDNNMIRNRFDIDNFNADDRDEFKLNKHLNIWCQKHNWFIKTYNFVRIDEKYIDFYIKIKTVI
jgi:hypothetical protein